MYELYTPSARQVVTLAEAEADRLGHPTVGTEHLLLGILAGGGAAARVLAECGASLDPVRLKVAEAVSRNSESRSSSDDAGSGLTPRARRALERSSRFSLQHRADKVHPEHVLLGVLDVEGTAGQALRGLMVDVVRLRRLADAAADALVAPPTTIATPTIPAPAPTPPKGRANAGRGPSCPGCGAPLGAVLAHAVVASDSASGGTMPFVVVYCSACGRALGATPQEA